MGINQDIWQSLLNNLSENKTRFCPIRGTQDAINRMTYSDGNIYFATDSKMIWLDTYILNSETNEKTLSRILMGNGAGGGSSNVGFIYANAEFSNNTLEQPNLDEPIYYIYKQAFSEDLIGLPLVDTLIINSNGWFFKVIEQGVGEFSNRVTAELISSGSGGGGGESKADTLKIQVLDFPRNLINGKDAEIVFIPFAAKNRQGNNIDDFVTIHWKLEYTENNSTYIQYANGILDLLPTGEEYHFNFGEKARYSSTSKLTLVAEELNVINSNYTFSSEFITSDLTLKLPSSFSNNNVFNSSSVSITCLQEGNMDKLLEFYWDNELIEERVLDSNSISEQVFNVSQTKATHGYHSVKLVLNQYIGRKKGFSLDPIEFELAVTDGESQLPIIWLGNYKSLYYNYDNIQIPFRINVPNGIKRVHLYKENKEIEGSPREIIDESQFSIFEIVDFDLNMQNHYSISWEEDPENIVKRDIYFSVEQDPNRLDFGIQKKAYLTLNFDASGRSNSESELKRTSWSYTDENNIKRNAIFENFNWYNNGWITENNKTCLRISNGAKFSIPIGDMWFATQNDREQSHTFEFQFKIRNVQDYSNLIRTITRYENDDVYFNEFYDTVNNEYKTDYTNYDAFLANWFKTHEIYDNNGKRFEYDDLVFSRVEKQVNLKAIACGFYSGGNQSITGICLGPQDAFFSNGTNTVNVNYVEDNIINLSMVYQYSNDRSLIYIYINGVLTGVVEDSEKSPFSITSTDNTIKSLVFNSQYCDIDLYKIRFYRTALNVNDIVTNFAVDLKDVLIYDQNKLAVENNSLKEYQFNYRNMINYNNEHLDSPIMPYIIFDTTNSNNDDKLSYSKAVKVNIGVEFVNTPLELAYRTGELETLSGPSGDKLWNNNSTTEEKAEAVKKYYQHHCPSFIGENVQMTVQGTSSEFYPRRNYKLKTKTDKVNIYLNRGPFEIDYSIDPESTHQDYWYMDNYVTGTTKFTMKIDYMESSGSYNMGFANLVKNAYSKHPFDDLNNNNAFTTDETIYTVATEYQEGTTYWYKNQKGNWKNSKDDELTITSEEHFNEGPVARNAELGLAKVLTDTSSTEYNKWYTANTEYVNYNIPNTSSYRTSVQGFRTLAFHKKSDGSYTYIGMYNMLLDKGSDEVYGFKPDKTTGVNVFQKYLKNKKISKIAECWEFENNSRTFCSFRDPMNRKDLSFDVYNIVQGEKIPVLSSTGSAPVVADSFEYRYHTDGDILDYVMDPDKNGEKLTAEDTVAYMTKNNVRLDFNKDNKMENYQARADVIFKDYKNWEKAVAWVWSTNTDSVLSGGIYQEKDGLGNQWHQNTYYLYDAENDTYVLDTGVECLENIIYYKQEIVDGQTQYNNAYIVADDNLVYQPNKYYIQVNGDYVLSSEPFDKALTYYEFISLSDEEMAENGNYDRLVQQCNENTTYDPNETYYRYNGEAQAGNAVTVANISEEDFLEDPTQYYIGITVTYDTRSYKYDTKEYRSDKFVKELNKHFDIEYLATYFVMTEVFECYDSRGKNCMFASWGPQEQNGEYIWYPIFYDIDTQLGINNTGIPSFEYNVDATENGNFSTSDSILWNNFYKFFKSSYILMKYKHLKGITAGVQWDQLLNPPLKSVDNIEAWYRTNPDVCKSIVMRGKRPLIAINLDEFYKYITITNPQAIVNQVGWAQSDGSIGIDGGTYFYALQGDRSLSRQQFLTNRLEYIDSWLNQGNYMRGGNNRMWGRVAANNPTTTSDKWIEDPNDANTSYYLSNGEKRNKFDAEYWLTLTPTHSTYVTLGDDNEAYPSRKYDGIKPVKFDIASIEKGVRQSANYPEQLLYVYGMNQMADVGEMNNMYWQEFKIEGEAKHLTRLILGSDELDEENNPWKNDKLNPPTIPSSKNSSGMPLLKEVNLSNITISELAPTLDFTSCEKLQNFRATGSNLRSVKFAEGVSLDTLYLPDKITQLELIEARLLTNLITSYEAPERDSNNKLVAAKGLYIEGLFDKSYSVANSLTTINIVGGSLGYDSYKLLKQYYDIRNGNSITGAIAKINMTNVKWSPYILVENDEEYSGNESDYRIIDNHYGLSAFTYSEANWPIQVANNEIYKINTNINSSIYNQINSIDLFDTFIKNNNWQGLNSTIPNITGIVYIDNDETIDEAYIRNTLQVNFPYLTFLFKTVTKKPTARFIYLEDDGKTYHYIKTDPLSVQTLADASAAANLWFSNPITTYLNLDKFLANYDFFGWAKETTNDAIVNNETIFQINDKKYEILVSSNSSTSWNRPEGDLNMDYTFYAIFKLHAYERIFYNADGVTLIDRITQQYDPENLYGVNETSVLPFEEIEDASGENLYMTNKFIGWALTRQPNTIVDLSTLSISSDYTFIAKYEKISVYDNILDDKYLVFEKYNNQEEYWQLSANSNYILSGKITLPVQKDNKYVYAISGFNSQNQITHIFFEQNENRQLTTIGTLCFQNCTNLKYVEPINTLTNFGNSAFSQCQSLQLSNIESLIKNGNTFGNTLFSNNTQQGELKISGHNISYIGERSFSTFPYISSLIIGFDEPLKWIDLLSNSSNIFDRPGNLRGGLTKLHIYIPSAYQDKTDEIMLKLGLSAYVTNMSVNNLNDNFTWIILDDEG